MTRSHLHTPRCSVPARLMLLAATLLAGAAPCPATAQSTTAHFAVIGDYGLAGQPEADVSTLVHSWNPDFIITVGDNNYYYGQASTMDANVGQYYQDYIFPYKGTFGPGATVNKFWPTLGHHDWGDTSPNPTGDQPYLDYFTLPNNERYYDFVRGPVHFFALDSDVNEPDGISSTSTQAQWLKSKLAAATEPWKVVYFHNPPYSSSSDPGDIQSQMAWPFKTWGASIVLNGKAHGYERLIENGFPYIVDALGGEPEIQPFGTPISGSIIRYNADFGAMVADATSTTLTFRFITRTGQLIDTYEMSTDPLMPTSLVATGGNGQVSLSWTAAPNATSYNVKRATTSGGPYSLVMSGVTGTTYVDSTVSQNTTYYYVVTGVSATSESAPSNEASATPTGSTVRINCGGSQYTGSTGIWQADTYYLSGYAASYNPPSIANTNDPTLFLTVRASPTFSYSIPAPNGTYTLNLYFAECTMTGPGQRLMNVNVNGTSWLTNFDIYATAGAANTAVVKSTPVTVSNGTLRLDFASQISGVNAVCAAIELIPQTATQPPSTPSGLKAVAGNAQVQLQWSAATGASSYNVKRGTATGGPYTTVGQVTSTSYTDSSVTNGTTYYYVVTAVNAVGESGNSNEASATPTATIRINCGGGQYVGSTVTYAADTDFVGGYVASYSSRTIANTSDQPIYLTVRASPTFSYSIPAPNGTYTLALHFAECTFTASGQRLMNINVNGTPWLTNFDIYATAGANTALVKSTTVTVANGTLQLDFASQLSGVNAICQAIELIPTH